MKTRLEQLTVSQLADLASGDKSVILENGDHPDEEDVTKAARDIMVEYRQIADPGGLRGWLVGMEDLSKARLMLQLMTMCRLMCDIGRHDKVREVLSELDENTAGMSEERVRAEVLSRIGRAESVIREEQDVAKDNKIDVKRQFDEQTVAMMTHFQFQIDPMTMSASLYACIVARYSMDMKAMKRVSKNR